MIDVKNKQEVLVEKKRILDQAADALSLTYWDDDFMDLKVQGKERDRRVRLLVQAEVFLVYATHRLIITDDTDVETDLYEMLHEVRRALDVA